jgi:hypothetical protein
MPVGLEMNPQSIEFCVSHLVNGFELRKMEDQTDLACHYWQRPNSPNWMTWADMQ